MSPSKTSLKPVVTEEGEAGQRWGQRPGEPRTVARGSVSLPPAMVMLFPQFSARPSLWTAHPGSCPGANSTSSHACYSGWQSAGSEPLGTGLLFNHPRPVRQAQGPPISFSSLGALCYLPLFITLSICFHFLCLLEYYHKLGGLKTPLFVA